MHKVPSKLALKVMLLACI